MTTGAIYLTEASSGAPALSGTNGALNAVLDWALVQKGWSIEYTAANARVYRPGSGNRNRLLVVHDSAVTGDAKLATIRGAENASAASVEDLVNPFPTVAQQVNNASSVMISNSASSAARPYRIVVSPTFLFFTSSTSSSNTGNWDFFFFGDLEGTEPGDAFATAIHVGATSTTASVSSRAGSSCASISMAAGKTYFARSIDGTVLSTTGTIGISASGTASAASLMSFNPSRPNMRAGYGSRIEREKMAVRCLGSNTTAASATLQIYQRGWIPNVWAPLHSNIGTVTSDDVHTDTAYAVGSQFVLVPCSLTSACLLETTDTWSPPQ